MNSLRTLALAAVLVAAVLTGCRTSRTAAEKEAAALSEAEYIRQVGRQSDFDFRTLSATMYLELNPDTKDETGSRARLKIIRGERLQISITPLAGFELFRLEVSCDSVKIIDRMGKRYAAERIADVMKQIPDYARSRFPYDFRYEHLEALLTNRLFTPDGSPPDIDAFKHRRLILGYRTFSTKDAEGIRYDFTTDSRARLEITGLITPFTGLRCRYSYFHATVSGRSFPTRMVVEVDDKPKLEIQLSKVETDVPVEIHFPIPEKYRRINLRQLWFMFNF